MKIIITSLLCMCSFILSAQNIDSMKLMNDLRELSSDRYEGRKPGTYGGRLAQYFLVNRFKEIGLQTYYSDYRQGLLVLGDKIDRNGPDSISNFKQTRGANIIGYITGSKKEVIVISAHFDHVGIIDKQIYNGADDNASGVCAMLAIAEYFRKNPPEHTLIFAAFDAEEILMKGSIGFIQNLPVPLNQIILNVNMDLIGTNTNNQMFVGGTHFTRSLKPLVEKVWNKSSIIFRYGYDIPNTIQDRTYRSDHAVFHHSKIPFLYFGVPEHPNYHKPTDDYQNISHPFYFNAVNLILKTVIELDQSFPAKPN